MILAATDVTWTSSGSDCFRPLGGPTTATAAATKIENLKMVDGWTGICFELDVTALTTNMWNRPHGSTNSAHALLYHTMSREA